MENIQQKNAYPPASAADAGGPSLAHLRTEYARQVLDEATTDPDALGQFQAWFAEAQAAGLPEPNAMHLATVSAEGRPSGRVVLLKGVDAQGFVFFTNYVSRKGKELPGHAWAALTFFWPELERQVRIEGEVERVTDEESDAYFQMRPRASQIGAWASPQSAVLENRQVLEARQHELEILYADGQPIPRPPHWGGYRLLPDRIEFWQGRPSRLHDRILYTAQPDGQWLRQRLAP